MKHRALFTTLTDMLPTLVAAGALLAVGCSSTIGGDGDDAGGTTGGSGPGGSSGASSGSSGSSGDGSGGTATGGSPATGGSSGAGGSGGSTGVPCVGTHVTTAKRIVKLTDNQIVNTYSMLFGATATATFTMNEDIQPPETRAFPPLSDVGTLLSDQQFALRDRLATAAVTYFGANTATLTACGPTPTDATCGQNAVLSFAEKGYRRPLTADERTSLQTLWTELTTTNGGSVAEAMRFGYLAVLESPQFLYRTEYGGDWTTQGPLDQYEIASEVSYFLTDGPPDAPLLQAAAANQLSDKATLRTQADRILATPAAHANLEAAMISYFDIDAMPTSIPEAATPGFTVSAGLKSSLVREGELFMENTLWAGTLGDLITSRRTWANVQIAMPLYGVAAPSTDANVFSEIMLPEDRRGLLTLAPFLTSRTRPTGASVVGRGLAVNAALVCSVNPLFPEDDTSVADAIAAQEGWSEKQKADFRANPDNGPCAGCHAQFDAMGIVLEHYDAIGRYRTMDLDMHTIDQAWTTSTLPENFDRDTNADGTFDQVAVSSPAELATELLRDDPRRGNSNALTRCMAMNIINFALADESQGSARAVMADHPTNSCAVRSVTDAFVTGDKSFSSLVREIVASDTLSLRSPGM
jgi:hypothetical protein